MASNIQCPSNPSKFHIFLHVECHDNIILINQVNKSQYSISFLFKVVCFYQSAMNEIRLTHFGNFVFNYISYFYLKSKNPHLVRNKIQNYENPVLSNFISFV